MQQDSQSSDVGQPRPWRRCDLCQFISKISFFPLFPSASCLCATKRSFFRDRVCYSIALLYYSVSNRRIIASVMSRCLIKGACIKLTYSSCAASSASVPSDLKALYKSVIIIIIIMRYRPVWIRGHSTVAMEAL